MLSERGEAGRRGETDPAEGTDDQRLVAALRRGDEAVFAELLDRYHAPLIRLATRYVSSHAVAEEVVQETWIGVLQGIDQFKGRSSFKTWLFRILINQAQRRGGQEGRSVPFSALSRAEGGSAEAAVEPERFFPSGHPSAGDWATPLWDWRETPEDELLSRETRAQVQQAVDALPPGQRAVINLRDVEGHTAAEVCRLLDISETNQRVLLHRARAKVRCALERYLEGT